MNILSNPTFNDIDTASRSKEFCPHWSLTYLGDKSENIYDILEESPGETGSIQLSLKAIKSWFRLTQYIEPIQNSAYIRFSIKASNLSMEVGQALNIRIMEVCSTKYHKTYINVDSSFVVPSDVQTHVVKVPTKRFYDDRQYALVIEANLPMELALWDVSLEFLDEKGKPLYPEHMPVMPFASSHLADQKCELKTEHLPLTENPCLIPASNSEIHKWEISCNYRIGLRLDQFIMPEALSRYGKKYTRMTFLERNDTHYPVLLRTPVRFNFERPVDSLYLCVHARTDRLTVVNCQIFEEKRLVAEVPLYIKGGWCVSTANLNSFPRVCFNSAKEHSFTLQFLHQGHSHFDVSFCCLTDSVDVTGFPESLIEQYETGVTEEIPAEPIEYVSNSEFLNWSRGICFDSVIPGQQIADHWFAEFRSNQADKFRIMASHSRRSLVTDVDLDKPIFSVRIKTGEFEGPLRLCTPVNLDALGAHGLQLSAQLSAGVKGRASSIRGIMLLARSSESEKVAYKLLRKQKVRNHTELTAVISGNDMMSLRRACGGLPSLVLCIEFEVNSDVVLGSVSLKQWVDQQIIDQTSDLESETLECEDPAIVSQLADIKGLGEWSSQQVVKQSTSNAVSPTIGSSAGLQCGGILERAADAYRPEPGFPSIDIIVPVYNALDSVKECIRSVIQNSTVPYTLICVDDASDAETASYLDYVANCYPNIICVRNKDNMGYTKSVNRGLRKANAEFVCILNSDCIVTPRWLEQLVDCAKSDDNIAMVGPLSNAASYQSVPKIYDAEGDWNFNPLPCSLTLEGMAKLVHENSLCGYPSVRVINGFCQFLRRSVIEEVGILDETAFPRGFGEENDFCARVIEAGYEIRIADDTYVFHTKSQSFGNRQRKELSALGSKALRVKHPTLDWKKITKEIENDPALITLRKNILSSEH